MKQKTRWRVDVACFGLAFLAGTSRTLCAVEPSGGEWFNTEPRWEIGAMLGGASLPMYKGSSESKEYVFPFPYLAYRGEKVSLDDESITGALFKSDRLDFATSIFLDVNSNDDARDGMPELDELMFAAGPAAKLYLARKRDRGFDLYVDLPVRAAISAHADSSLSTNYRGLQTKVNLCYESSQLFGLERLDFTGVAGVAFYDSDLASYYYDVEDAYATDDRPAFDTRGGFAGTTVSINLLYRVGPRISVRLFGRVESVAGTVFEDSPLVSQDLAAAGGVVFYFRLFQSADRVARR